MVHPCMAKKETSEPVRIQKEYLDAIEFLMRNHKEIKSKSDFINEAVAVRLVNYGVGLK